LAEDYFCTFCERWLDESRLGRLLHRHGAARSGGDRVAGASERLLLALGLGVFALVAAASIILALTT